MSEATKDFILKNGEEQTKTAGTDTKSKTQSAGLPKMTFATFIISLNHSALVHMGMVEDPVNGTKAKNLELAKQTIDVIAMLEEKTKGNLTEEESEMIKSLLYDLRILYVKETR
jgi:hypothetical protein